MLDLDNIKSGEQLSEEQLKDFLGNKEEKVESSLPEGFDPEKMSFSLDERSNLPEGFDPEKGIFTSIPKENHSDKIQALRNRIKIPEESEKGTAGMDDKKHLMEILKQKKLHDR